MVKKIFGIFLLYIYETLNIEMAKNKCQWLKIASLDHCNRHFIGQYCWIHNARLKKSPGTTPCIKCLKVVEINI